MRSGITWSFVLLIAIGATQGWASYSNSNFDTTFGSIRGELLAFHKELALTPISFEFQPAPSNSDISSGCDQFGQNSLQKALSHFLLLNPPEETKDVSAWKFRKIVGKITWYDSKQTYGKVTLSSPFVSKVGVAKRKLRNNYVGLEVVLSKEEKDGSIFEHFSGYVDGLDPVNVNTPLSISKGLIRFVYDYENKNRCDISLLLMDEIPVTASGRKVIPVQIAKEKIPSPAPPAPAVPPPVADTTTQTSPQGDKSSPVAPPADTNGKPNTDTKPPPSAPKTGPSAPAPQPKNEPKTEPPPKAPKPKPAAKAFTPAPAPNPKHNSGCTSSRSTSAGLSLFAIAYLCTRRRFAEK